MSRQNNFDCLRLFAALMVLISHSFALTNTPVEPVRDWFGGYDTGGSMAVAVFFVISGFLVSESVSRRSTADYLASRVIRIIPALIIVSFFDAFVIGPIFTAHPLASYFSNAQTWGHLLNPLVFRMDLFLPGVFETTPVPSVNGSLWTLPCECGLYLILPALAFCGGLTKRGAVIAFIVCGTAYLAATDYFGINFSHQGPLVINGVTAFNAFKHATFFFAGAALWANRDAAPLHRGGALLCIALLFACARTIAAPAAYITCVPYLVIFAAIKLPAVSLEKVGDLSYGTYLFAYPVQQALVSVIGVGHPIRVSAAAIPIVLTLAFLSWRLVEKPALQLRRRKAVVIAMPSAVAKTA